MKRYKDLETILTISTGLLVLFFILDLKGHIVYELLYVAAGISVISLISKWVAKTISWLWMKLAEGLGFLSSKILLSVVFFVFLIPIAFLARLFGKSQLQLKKNNHSYYSSRDHEYSTDDLENIW